MLKTIYKGLLALSLPLYTALASAVMVLPTFDSAMVCGHENALQAKKVYGGAAPYYGISWFSGTNARQRAVCKMADVKQVGFHAFFNPSKTRTLIIFHGWSPGTVAKKWRLNFDTNDQHGPNVQNSAALWLKGDLVTRLPWNIGIFYWNQFADETPDSGSLSDFMVSIARAEQKIWRTPGECSAPSPCQAGMRWKDSAGVLHPDFPLNQNITDMAYKSYVSSLKRYKGEVRLMGESLGTQLVLALAEKIRINHVADQVPMPTQIILLDPIFTTEKYPFFGDQPKTSYSQAMIIIDHLIQDGVVISGYRTSPLGHMHVTQDNTPLLNKLVFTDLSACVYAPNDFQHRHETGLWWYMLSYGLDHINVEQPINHGIIESAPFANSPLWFLQSWMGVNRGKFMSDKAYNLEHYCQGRPDNFEENIRNWPLWMNKVVDKNTPSKEK